jgi:phenylpyruvate tautomerase PptA (4-oxalocrotonate tautomerase family)
MPFVNVTTNIELDKQRLDETLGALSRFISDILGKPESYVMAQMQPGAQLVFGGSADAAAYVQLASIGLPTEKTTDLSRELCTFLESALDIPSDRVYIAFADLERTMFGWDKRTFG